MSTKNLVEEARRCEANYRGNDLLVSELVGRLADALESATRVPVQGEPNDNREVLAELIAEHEEYPHPRGYLGHADVIIAAGFSRASVPDAATDAGLLEIARRDATRFEDEAVDAMAEREALRDAVARVRAIHASELVNAYYGGTHSICIACERPYPCQTIAALDGAPEPEVEWQYSIGHQSSISGHYFSDAEREYEEMTTDIEEAREWLDQALCSGTYTNAILLRKAPTPPWRTVEGENDVAVH